MIIMGMIRVDCAGQLNDSGCRFFDSRAATVSRKILSSFLKIHGVTYSLICVTEELP